MRRLGEIWTRPIPAERSLVAFAAVAVTLIVAATVLISIPSRDPGELSSEAMVVDAVPALPNRGEQLERTIERGAREFMVGYLALIAGQGEPHQVTFATPELKGQLNRPARVPPAARHRDQRVTDARAHLASAGRASVTVAVEVDRIAFPVILQMVLEDGRWLVEKVGAE